jgi:hypothetical protein
MFDCEFCKKSFASKSNLNLHKKTTKRCLKIQQEQCSKTEEVKYSCKYCEKEFLLSHHVNVHEQNCRKKDSHAYEQLKKKYDALKEKCEKQTIEIAECKAVIACNEKYEKQNNELVNKLTDKTSVTNNNIIHIVNTDEFKNLPEFTKENVCREFKKHMSPNVFLKGQDGVIDTVSTAFQNFVITTDASRMKGVIKDENSKVRKTTGIKIVKKGLTYISDANKDIIKKVPEIMPEYSINTHEMVGQAHVAMNTMRESIQNSEEDKIDRMIEQIAKKTINQGVVLG